MYNKIRLLFMVFIAITVWFGLILQFCISIPGYLATGFTLIGSIIQILSFFTIECNLLIAVMLVFILLAPGSSPGKLFSNFSFLTAAAVYITIVGLIYNVILRQLWQPEGLFKLTDDLLHTVVPVLFVLFWLIFVSKRPLQWRGLLGWALFPLSYLFYSLSRGAVTGLYPYNFIDAKQLGYPQTFINSFFVLIAFLIISSIFIGISRLLTGTIKAAN